MGIVKNQIYKCLEKKMGVNTKERFVPDINRDFTKIQKRVLIVYLDMFQASNQIHKNLKKESGTCHTNRYEFFQIIKCFIQLDCCIDICANYDKEAINYIKEREYDIVFGLGDIFRYVCSKGNAKYKILYLTENPYSVSLKKESERIAYFKERTGKQISLYRTGMFFKDGDENYADAIVCLGEKQYLLNSNKKVKKLYPTGFYNSKIKNFSQRDKKSFLVFGTDGFVHKGIDLLIEVFNKNLDWNLYICGYQVESQMDRLDLKHTDNIHDCGYIDVESNVFFELIGKCTYIVQPSCSEATSTAVLTGMRHGLIPIVMHGNGFDDFSQYCYFFDGYKIEQIEQNLKDVLKHSPSDIQSMSKKIYEYANAHFNLNYFFESMYKILEELINEEGNGNK